ncbi:receptor-interacting serine/threonine-protein kinase 1-like [Artemia franciscana]|uniref:receptor-interacting serine/threonine-protein kinase 1-like n=1 Tax=Artemia franciscana TaxID=6661 RepID=UPI0032DB026C
MQEDSIPLHNENPTFPTNNRQATPRKAKMRAKSFGHFQLIGGVNISNAAQIVHIGHNITIGSDKRQENVENITKTPAPDLCASKEPVSSILLNEVIRGIGQNWKEIGRSLDLSDITLEQVYMDHIQYGISEVIFQALQTWEQEQSQNATVGVLATALWKSNAKDALLILEDFQNRKQNTLSPST